MARPLNMPQTGIYGQLPSQQASNMMAQQQLLLQHRDVEYFYVYVAESDYFNVGYWIALEPDKTLSLENLRGYYSTCFGIKYKFVNAKNKVETKYIRYHNGYFRFPAGLDMNNTRFVAYYYNDVDDVNAFMEMAEASDNVAGMVPTLELRNPPVPENNDSTFLGRTVNNFDMANVLQRGAQSTPKVVPAKATLLENVSSTSDVILNEKTIEVISVRDSDSLLQRPPPPPGPPHNHATTPKTVVDVADKPKPSVSGIKAKLGPSVSSTSDLGNTKGVKRDPGIKHARITIDDSSGFRRENRSVMVRVDATPVNRNMLNRYQRTREQPQDVNEKTPLKITLKRRGRHIQRDAKILKIEDEKGRTTALLTKRKWAGTAAATETHKRRFETDDGLNAERYDKRRKYEAQSQQLYHQPAIFEHYRRQTETLNILLVGFRTNPPIIGETRSYFAEFGEVLNLQLYTMPNRQNATEYYALMKIRTREAVSLFADRHLYNGTAIYAIRLDGNRVPARVNCKICSYQGLNVAYLNYHMEGQFHQIQLQKRLDSYTGYMGDPYRDSYYRITAEILYVQLPNDAVQEMVPGIVGMAHYPSSNQHTERGRYF
ncbi:uncharacterized protein LOC131685956 [Topomyia yanbarensis]|uniref:uncharacterized protein LOC131685956 n=1 Tax=Topomyia yanbarensis TaxID=2498891 RepID=UPI00273B4DA8|nr:uncharacterized protein LOC131685956 [Topomyia yanbarensis]XP_058825973.1 uncharacterized protein LOC131685956 [Topomyia yanbarensis]